MTGQLLIAVAIFLFYLKRPNDLMSMFHCAGSQNELESTWWEQTEKFLRTRRPTWRRRAATTNLSSCIRSPTARTLILTVCQLLQLYATNFWKLTPYGHIDCSWVSCYIWNSEEGPGRAAASPSTLLAVPNVTAHPSTAIVPITVLLYDGLLFCGINMAIKGLKQRTSWSFSRSRQNRGIVHTNPF